MEYLVCNIEKDSCMLDTCSECPGSETLYEVLANEIDNLPEEVVFKEWVYTHLFFTTKKEEKFVAKVFVHQRPFNS